VRIGVKAGQWGWTFEELSSSWKAAEQAGFDLISCFDHVAATPNPERAAWDAPTLLTAMAGVTQRIGLAVHVVNTSLRHPFLLAGQLAVAQAAGGGRLEIGLGAGSFHLARIDHLATGIPFPSMAERVERLEACCRSFPRLWRGERVDDAALGLEGASLGPIDIAPPRLVVGGSSDAVIEIAARHADAWNCSDPPSFVDRNQRLSEICDEIGRSDALERQVQLFAIELDAGDAKGHVTRLGDAGAETVVLVLDRERGASEVERLADQVL
jgi:alkanesulfonate monooxygenase SsuD/methylene tetrahydromethanopterin reductase-like flavin-dependent oxidoreductase (luciferase family)